jgi:alginate O-acetyltransferase complex protein AlgI
MVFSSWSFLCLFLPLVLLVYHGSFHLTSGRQKQTILLAASWIFYAYWDWHYWPLLFTTTLSSYYLGLIIYSRRSKALVALSVSLNLAPLIYFKYAGWLSGDDTLSSLILPLGISFFTFQQITFTIDSYRQIVKPAGFINYAAYIAFFPQLIAGPIIHFNDLAPQMLRLPRPSSDQIQKAFFLIAMGLFKKLFIADSLGEIADSGFTSNTTLGMVDAWVTTLAYTGQIFCDFSGYCEMALGFALLFGIDLPLNFATPYKSSSITEFWRRWHITLGKFFRDYVYIPLGGNRSGIHRTLIVLLLVSLLSGFWHGAGNQFLLWGVLHGLALCLHRLWSRSRYQLPVLIGQIITFLFVVMAWVPFRAEDISTAVEIWTSMMGMSMVIPNTALFHQFDMLKLLLLMWLMWELPDPRDVTHLVTPKKCLWYASATLSSFWLLSGTQSFLYFNF